ncbi:MAG: sulfur carrier protein ThiS adenylyltransferase ThiF [Bacteroidales bacterium]
MTFEEIKNQLKNYTVGIAGAGGLGSNCAVALARVGIGKLVIADFDVVSKSNLNRQYFFLGQIGIKKVVALKENINRISTAVEVEIHDIKLNEQNIVSLYKDCNIIVEAFDLDEMKKMLIETCIAEMPNIPVVIGSGIAGYGDNNSLKCRKNSSIYICGDEKSEVSEQNPTIAPRVAIVANMQANMVLELLLSR